MIDNKESFIFYQEATVDIKILKNEL